MSDDFELAWWEERGEAYGRLLKALNSPYAVAARKAFRRKEDEVILRCFLQENPGHAE